jgi:Mlc titration factor MtfA (ptsG expression regulator)
VAHALDDQTGDADGTPLLADREAVEAWSRASGAAFADLERDVRRRRKTLLDPYAAEDPAEFFAVVTETFLEAPMAFQAVYPELYRLLRDFYKLDPVTWAPRLAATPPR